jgi:hypothetical protein
MVIAQDVQARGPAVLQRIQPEASITQQWRAFFVAVVNSVTRVWLLIAAVRIRKSIESTHLIGLGICRIPHQYLSNSIYDTATP